MKNILIVEDDPQILKILNLNFKLSGLTADNASSVEEAWRKISSNDFDLILLDNGLPDGSGLDLCEKIRIAGNDVPILFLSAQTDEATVVKGITSGGDDYLRKPFGMEELKARMSKVFKRFAPVNRTIVFGDLSIDPARRVMTLMNEVVTLGKKEMEILMLLARKTGEIVSRETILHSLYDSADMYDRTIDSHMSHLRKKLKEIAGKSLQINSVYGLGYRLEWRS